MRIDVSSLIAAQSAPRATPAAPKPAPEGARAADNALFEPLIFREAKVEEAAPKPQGVAPPTPPRRPGALLDITV